MAPGLTSEKDNQMSCRNKTRVATEVILQRMRQQAAERRRDEGRPPVRGAWAPVLADSGTRLRDIRVQCDEDDHGRVLRLETMLESARATASEQKRCNEMLHDSLTEQGVTIGKQEGEIKRLQEENDALDDEIDRLQEESDDLLESARATASEQKRCNEMLHDSLTRQGVTIGKQEGEIQRLQKENDTLEDEIDRLQEENDDLRLAAHVEKTIMVVKDLHEKELCAPLLCPISMQLFKDPVVSIYGHSFERHDIEKWLLEHECCPMTREHLTIAHLTPNFALAGVADAFRFYEAAPAEEEKPAE
jgi:cell division protein FtsB